jgi:uncharacterized protein YfaS (alpha-2-macroglobulin family)
LRKILTISLALSCFFVNTTHVTAQEKPPQAKGSLFTAEQDKNATLFLKGILDNQKAAVSKYDLLKRQIKASNEYYAGDYAAVVFDLEPVLKDNPKDLSAWIMLVDAGGRKELAEDESFKKNATLSAINAYKVAADPLDKAVVLQMLARLDENFQAAFKAELTKFTQKQIDERFQILTTDYPKIFNVYDVEVPEKSDVGSACFSFTKPLLKLKSFRYEDYISISPQVKDFSVVAKGSRLCVSGLAFGSSYNITLKKGLAGEGNYKLSEDQTLNLLIKHRKPSIMFRERGYILPAKGPQLLPLKAINVPSVKIKVLKISAQNMPHMISQGYFLNQMISWNVEQLKNDSAELVAEGTFDCNGNIDETLLRGLPLDKILGEKLEAGVYVVQAQVSDKNNYAENESATQWVVVSDIGLSTYSGPDGLHVTSRSLETAQELAEIELNVIARNGRSLGTATTDKNGYAHFDEKMLAGKDSNAPIFIQATNKGKDFTFIAFNKEGFDFSDRGVKGRTPAKKADAYIYTERGIYRPGEKVNITALLRDQTGKALPQVPLTFRVFRPDNVEVFTEVTQDAAAGAHTFVLDTQANSYSGEWSVAAYLDPKGLEIGRTTFRIADFVPPRIDVKIEIKQKVVHALETLQSDVSARYFYGPWAAGLKAEGLVELVEEKQPFEKWKDYQFGLEEESWTPRKFKAESTTTNEKGQTSLSSIINVKPDTTKVLSAKSIATVFETGGRGRSVTQKTLFWHQPYAIGVLPNFHDKTSPGNGDATFNLIAVDETGALKKAAGLKYTLYEETHGFTWFRSGGNWNYEVAIEDRSIATGNLDLKEDQPTAFKIPVQFGHYRLEIMDEKTGVATSYRFHAGWGGTSDLPDRPDMIEMSLDKASYKPGEKATLSMVSPFDGELVIVALDETSFHQVYRGKATQKGTRIDIPLSAELLQKSGTYLMATIYRAGDVKSEKISGRAIGLIWTDAKSSMPKIELSLKTPTVIQPEKAFEARVCFAKAQKNPHVTISVVDEAILQLTEFKTPDPFNYIFDQTKLAFTIRDSYGQLINPYGARPGDFKVGGDGLQQNALKKLAARTYKTVSLYSGIISEFTESKEEGCAQSAKVSFNLPDFSGQVRVMAVAWNEEATGSTEATVVVREPLETYIALPRFLAPDDQTTLIVDAQNLTEAEGTFKVTLKTEGEVALVKEFSQTLTLAKDQMVHLPVDIKAKGAGVGKLTMHIEGPQGLVLDKHWEIAVRSPVFEVTQKSNGILKPGEALTLDESKLAQFRPGTGQMDLSIGSYPTFGAERLRKELKGYPYACLEQLTSRLVAEMYAPQETRDAPKIVDLISGLVSLQHFDGPFALWAADGPSEPLLSLYALELLNKAQAEKIEISQATINRSMDWLKEKIRQNSGDTYELSVKAYAHYILAKQGQGTLGALKYFADNSQDQLVNRDDLVFVAAAFALYGDAQSAKIWFDKAIAAQESKTAKRNFYQTWISDTAILVSLLAETVQNHPKLMDLSLQLADMATKPQYLSTFEKSWLVRASTGLSAIDIPFQITINEEKVEASKALNRSFTPEILKGKVAVKNQGQAPLNYALNAIGQPLDISKLPHKGFKIARELYDLKGNPIAGTEVKSGDLLVVVLKGELSEANTHEVMVLDMLPAGFEIETVKFDENYLKENLEWLENLTQLSRVEKRDDRFVAAFRMTKPGKFLMTYFVRALNPGTYNYPAAVVESMYRPDFTARTAEGKLTIKP